VARDPAGIRPAYYYANDEVVVVASEKPAIKTSFDVDYNEIKEVEPGHALIIKKNGEFNQFPFIEKLPGNPAVSKEYIFPGGRTRTFTTKERAWAGCCCRRF
jgi:asparagine synthetase B (glutamine-hydrolysing)